MDGDNDRYNFLVQPEIPSSKLRRYPILALGLNNREKCGNLLVGLVVLSTYLFVLCNLWRHTLLLATHKEKRFTVFDSCDRELLQQQNILYTEDFSCTSTLVNFV